MFITNKNKDLFNNFVKKVEQQREELEAASEYTPDPRFIKMEAGKSYAFRLLYWKPEGVLREGPFIENWVHGWKNSNDQYRKIICPTTQEPKLGFKKCPVCDNVSTLWNKGQAGDEAAEALRKQQKRRLYGYAQVYVIKDPTTPENEGHVKILRYGVYQREFFEQNIFGRGLEEGSILEPLYTEAFDLNKGYDLLVSITKKGEFNNYNYSFSRNQGQDISNVPHLETELQELKFDDLTWTETSADIEKFYREHVLEDSTPHSMNAIVDVPTQQVQTPVVNNTSSGTAPSQPMVETVSTPDPLDEVLNNDTSTSMDGDMTQEELESILNDL